MHPVVANPDGVRLWETPGLSVIAFNLNPVDPETDGGFACVPGTHKSNYRFPNGWRNMQQGVHPTVQRIGGDAGSCIIFTEVSVNELRGAFDVCWPVIDINPSNRQMISA